ncbi:MAG: hypothetical protein IPK04_15255 [Bdellovibrionales bacterium]|nr:hypothetical protein [Bdellovibrionales bacterium]
MSLTLVKFVMPNQKKQKSFHNCLRNPVVHTASLALMARVDHRALVAVVGRVPHPSEAAAREGEGLGVAGDGLRKKANTLWSDNHAVRGI